MCADIDTLKGKNQHYHKIYLPFFKVLMQRAIVLPFPIVSDEIPVLYSIQSIQWREEYSNLCRQLNFVSNRDHENSGPTISKRMVLIVQKYLTETQVQKNGIYLTKAQNFKLAQSTIQFIFIFFPPFSKNKRKRGKKSLNAIVL